MQIRTQIFSWVFLATILPLTAMALVATYYIESDYERGAREAIDRNLSTLSAELKRHLQTQQDLAMGLSRANVVQAFLPHLHKIKNGTVAADFHPLRDRINYYFEGFQTVLSGMYIMRLMDKQGNTLVKVTNKSRSAAVYESMNGVTYVEQEISDSHFFDMLKNIPENDIGTTVLIHNKQQSEVMSTLALLDYVVPLYHEDELVGALSVTLFGEEIDRILSYAPRLYNAALFLAENNPDDPARNGMVLFDDIHEINLRQIRNESTTLTMLYGEKVSQQVSDTPVGIFYDDETAKNIYYMEIFPYPSRLTSWIIGMRVPQSAIAEPFQQLRWVIWVVASIALIISLFLADIGVRLIARPVKQLARHLLSYARGEHAERVPTTARINEIRDLEQAFNQMADSLDKASRERDSAQNMMLQSVKLASIGQMAAGIGHELNNPLNNILSYTKLLERNIAQLDERSYQDLQSLKEETLRASDIVSGILNFARQVPPRYEPFHVQAWLLDTFTLVRQSAKNAGIVLTDECHDDFIIEGDRAQLQQVLINLLLNAIQASEPDGMVKVIIGQSDSNAVISVIDHGKGIAKKDLDKVFDPFYTTKPEGEGTGLGLSISLGIVERHNGKLLLEPNPDGGTISMMLIPLKSTEPGS